MTQGDVLSGEMPDEAGKPTRRRGTGGNREINFDALAIQNGLKCSIPGVRKAARDYLERVVIRHGGNIARITETLGIDRKTYWRWRQEHDFIEQLHVKVTGDDSPE